MPEVTPKVSILLPTHDRPGPVFFEAAVESILAQSLSDWELIVIQNGTPAQIDYTASRDLTLKDERARWLVRANAGLPEAINYGLEYARGRYLWIMEDDDLAHPDFLRVLAGHLDRHTCGTVYCLQLETDMRGQPDWRCHVRGRYGPEGIPTYTPELLRRQNLFNHPQRLTRLELVRRVGGCDPAAGGASDWDLNLKLQPFGICELRQFLSIHRWHTRNYCQLGDALRGRALYIRRKLERGEYD